MTRITNFGRKRTYLEAGFAATLAETADPAVLAAMDEPATENAPPMKKKRSKQEGDSNSKTMFSGKNNTHLKQGKSTNSAFAILLRIHVPCQQKPVEQPHLNFAANNE